MKNLNRTIILSVIPLVGCSISKQERLIKQSEETDGNTKTNLYLKQRKFVIVVQ
jgi:hypothetical protein